MTASLRGLPACNTEACGLSRTPERRQGFIRPDGGGARSGLHFARAAVEGEFTDEDLTPGRRVTFTTALPRSAPSGCWRCGTRCPVSRSERKLATATR